MIDTLIPKMGPIHEPKRAAHLAVLRHHFAIITLEEVRELRFNAIQHARTLGVVKRLIDCERCHRATCQGQVFRGLTHIRALVLGFFFRCRIEDQLREMGGVELLGTRRDVVRRAADWITIKRMLDAELAARRPGRPEERKGGQP